MFLSKLPLAGVPGVSFPEHGVSVSRNDLSALERLPDEVLELVVGDAVADFLPKLLEPNQHFLVGQAVERACQTVETCGKGEEGVAEGGAHQVGGVGGDVAAFVITGTKEQR